MALFQYHNNLCRLDLTGRLLLLPLAEPMGEVKGLFTI
jgi:hypothetical protein